MSLAHAFGFHADVLGCRQNSALPQKMQLIYHATVVRNTQLIHTKMARFCHFYTFRTKKIAQSPAQQTFS